MTSSKSSTDESERGATLVEFALSAGVLFMFLVLGVDTIAFGYSALTVQYVHNRAARDAMPLTAAGSIGGGNVDATARANIIAQRIKDLGTQYGVNLSDPATTAITICPLTDAACAPNDAGDPKTFVRISILRDYTFVWHAFHYRMNFSVVAKNEPF